MKNNKIIIKTLIEEFIYKYLEKEEYEIHKISSKKLLTWNRLDLAFKLFYLNNKKINPKLALEVYREDIKAQTLGEFTEYGNELLKNNFDTYIKSFSNTLNNIQENGFDKKKTLIPLSSDQSLINGSHRVSSAIYLEKEVYCITTEADKLVADYQYFFKRDVSNELLEIVVQEFIKYSADNIYIAFLWPSGKENKDRSEKEFSNIVYKKEIKLNAKGAFNLLFELYKHMDWIGNEKNGFQGINQKLIECFPSFNKFTVLIFQEDNLEQVQIIKKNVRKIHNIGFSSIHITDYKEEAIRISNLLLNKNGLHFLNFANPLKYKMIYNELNIFNSFLNKNKINKNEVLIDGSVILTLYGLRNNEDIDYLLLEHKEIKLQDIRFENHDSELKYHKINKNELITNQKYYFQYMGFKFISFEQLFYMKQNRAEEKDINDCNMMKSLIENNKFQIIKSKINQKILYFKIKSKAYILSSLIKILKKIGLYIIIRRIYRTIKGTEV